MAVVEGRLGLAPEQAVVEDPSAEGSFGRYIDHVPAAFAITHGALHTLVYANAAFRKLVAPNGEPVVGVSIAGAFGARATSGLTTLLDRAFRTGVVARDRHIEPVSEDALLLSCTVWPDVNVNGETQHLVIELRVATQGELTLGLQREVAERLLLGALREQDAADAAKGSWQGAVFLASESRRLAESLDEDATLDAMTRMSLPTLGAWCIVDTLDDDDAMHRLTIIHPDRTKQALLDELQGRWIPGLDDGFGLPAALRNAGSTLIAEGTAAVLATAETDREVLAALHGLGVGALLTVPIVIRDRLVGAVTFVGARDGLPFTASDIELAQDLASRAAMSLDRARLYGEAIALKARAEAASQAKGAFLGMMSHELRTPLNAIGGYVDLIDLEIHGPVTDAQRVDLGRIRTNQRYLMGLISDVLNFTKTGSGKLAYEIADFDAHKALEAGVALVEPLFAQKQLTYEVRPCDTIVVARGDSEKVTQILVNLLSNAIKFTPPGGRIVIDCEAAEDAILMRVSDTGIGIADDKLEDIFDPFVQVKGMAPGPEAGIGLGLAISRSLARGMKGNLTVTSVVGEGSRFTVSLPRSLSAHQLADLNARD